MKCACVILNYNDSEHTLGLVDRIKNFSNISQICIVDNQSTDDSVKQIRRKENGNVVILSSGHNGGYGYGNNAGIRYLSEHTDTKYVMIANPDTEIKESFVSGLIRALEEDKTLAAATGQPLDKNAVSRERAGWNLESLGHYLIEMNVLLSKLLLPKQEPMTGKGFYCECIQGSLLMVNLDYMLRYGMYDEEFFLYCEENVLGWKFRKAGYRAYVIPDTYVHNHSVSTKKTMSSVLQRQKILLHSHKLFLSKYYGVKKWMMGLLCPYFGVTCLINSIVLKIKER